MTSHLVRAKVVWHIDPEADTSYLEQPEFADRRAAYQRGDFDFIGCTARAIVEVNGTRQIVESAGLWGVEDDSSTEHMREIEAEQMAELRMILATLGIDTGP